MKCKSRRRDEDCPHEATGIVHWPGQDLPMCDEDQATARNVAESMGFALAVTPLPSSAGEGG